MRDNERMLAEAAARVITKAEEIGLPDAPEKLVTVRAIRSLARSHVELRDQVRALHDLVDPSDPSDPISAALAEVGLARRPRDWTHGGPRLVRAPAKVEDLGPDQLLAIYCRIMHETRDVFVQYETYVVRAWDGMDGCWIDCTGAVTRDEALRAWAERTEGGTRQVSYNEIDYCRIFPGGTHMLWDGSEGLEMHR